MDRGADARVADTEPSFEQRLRGEGADERDFHGGGHDPPDTEAASEGKVNLTKQALKKYSAHYTCLRRFRHTALRVIATAAAIST